MSIVWHKFPEEKPPKAGKYLVFSSDAYRPGYMIKTRTWGYQETFGPACGWEYGGDFITHWAEYPNTPEGEYA